MNPGQKNNPESESLLWENFQKGDSKALEKIFKQNYLLLFDYGMRMTRQEELVKDCIQDIFAYLWEKRENLSQVQSIRAYLIASFRRMVLKAIEQQSKKTHALESMKQELIPVISSFEDLLVLNEETSYKRQRLQVAIQKIPERMREALYLKTYQELSYDEISNIMKVRPQVARNYVFEAFKRLRQILKNTPNQSS